jgi:hypothetical protein
MNNHLDSRDFDAVIGYYNIGSLDRRQAIWDRAITPEHFAHMARMAAFNAGLGPNSGPHRGLPVDFEKALLELEKEDPYDAEVAKCECSIGMSFADEEFPETAVTSQDIARFFNEYNGPRDINCADAQKEIVKALVHDVLRWLSANAEPVGWHRRILEATMKFIRDSINPAIKENAIDSFVFKLATAITTQNQDVHPNASWSKPNSTTWSFHDPYNKISVHMGANGAVTDLTFH